MRELRYQTVHEDLIAGFPELAEPYRRLLDDWGNFGDEAPGQYIVFSDTYGTQLEVTLSLPAETAGREELLQRALDFGETMLSAPDAAVHDLGIDALAERLGVHPDGRAVAERLGGSSLHAWFAAHRSTNWERPDDGEIIDLWGVRQAISRLLPGTPTHKLPGISYPSSSPDLDSLAVARAAPDGTVMLAAYGTTHLCAVIRAAEVRAKRHALDDLAVHLAQVVGGELPSGEPGVRYRRIPPGERVWNMHRGDERHSRLWVEPWVADALSTLREPILSVLRGETQQVPPRP